MTIAYIEYLGNGGFALHSRKDMPLEQLEDMGACILTILRNKGVDIAKVLALADVSVQCAENYVTKEFIDTLSPSIN